MLALSRRRGESLVIQNTIFLTLIRIRNNGTARIAITSKDPIKITFRNSFHDIGNELGAFFINFKVGEFFVINETTKITNFRREGNQLKFTIDAPANIAINRAEIQELIDNKTPLEYGLKSTKDSHR